MINPDTVRGALNTMELHARQLGLDSLDHDLIRIARKALSEGQPAAALFIASTVDVRRMERNGYGVVADALSTTLVQALRKADEATKFTEAVEASTPGGDRPM